MSLPLTTKLSISCFLCVCELESQLIIYMRVCRFRFLLRKKNYVLSRLLDLERHVHYYHFRKIKNKLLSHKILQTLDWLMRLPVSAHFRMIPVLVCVFKWIKTRFLFVNRVFKNHLHSTLVLYWSKFLCMPNTNWMRIFFYHLKMK